MCNRVIVAAVFGVMTITSAGCAEHGNADTHQIMEGQVREQPGLDSTSTTWATTTTLARNGEGDCLAAHRALQDIPGNAPAEVGLPAFRRWLADCTIADYRALFPDRGDDVVIVIARVCARAYANVVPELPEIQAMISGSALCGPIVDLP